VRIGIILTFYCYDVIIGEVDERMVIYLATRQTLDGIKSNVMECLGKKVILRTNKGKRKVKVREGIIENVFPCIFTVRVDQGTEAERTISFSYSDILTESVEVTVVGTSGVIQVS
jgi:uncharacterized protein Veg